MITGGVNDGMLVVHDMRTNKLVMSSQIHKGAINSVKVNLQNFSNWRRGVFGIIRKVITGSADGTIRLIDAVSGFKTVC